MNNIFSRNELFWGKEFQATLAKKHVVVFGLGGVGGICTEMLARSGIGELSLIDFDKVSGSNINRQIIALNSNINELKTDLFFKKLKDINPSLKINLINDFYTKKMQLPACDYIADAIDSLKSKISLLETCYNLKTPVISSLGAGNRIDPTQLYICDISEIENKNAPFISNVLHQLKKINIETGIDVVVSREKPQVLEKISAKEQVITKSGEIIEFNKIIPSSTPFVPTVAGIFMAGFIVKKFML